MVAGRSLSPWPTKGVDSLCIAKSHRPVTCRFLSRDRCYESAFAVTHG